MRENTILTKLRAGQTIINGWLSSNGSFTAEAMGYVGFDCVTIDLQHGLIGIDTALPLFQALSITNTIPIARPMWNDPAQIMRLLDSGAYGIISPLISTVDDAAKLVSACLYPPRGTRSYGPARAIMYAGADNYYPEVDSQILKLAMIETLAGLENLDQILQVEGLDGVYIGPNDLSLAMGYLPKTEPTDKEVLDMVAHICERAHQHGKYAGMHGTSGASAAASAKKGFDFVTAGSDIGLLSTAGKAAVAAVRQA